MYMYMYGFITNKLSCYYARISCRRMLGWTTAVPGSCRCWPPAVLAVPADPGRHPRIAVAAPHGTLSQFFFQIKIPGKAAVLAGESIFLPFTSCFCWANQWHLKVTWTFGGFTRYQYLNEFPFQQPKWSLWMSMMSSLLSSLSLLRFIQRPTTEHTKQ